ncbi:universal stress protein [Actinomadura sp. B10D3]|uniref:universal stress protein n=1 Tax=Actinomadura sp. B10D3 TaxID=3153557 RepID=UPI00325DB4AF
MSDPIIVGADGSVPSERAVAFAADEAARYERALTVVHAVEKWPFDIPARHRPRRGEVADARGRPGAGRTPSASPAPGSRR